MANVWVLFLTHGNNTAHKEHCCLRSITYNFSIIHLYIYQNWKTMKVMFYHTRNSNNMWSVWSESHVLSHQKQQHVICVIRKSCFITSETATTCDQKVIHLKQQSVIKNIAFSHTRNRNNRWSESYIFSKTTHLIIRLAEVMSLLSR